jgi:hypothetical protein
MMNGIVVENKSSILYNNGISVYISKRTGYQPDTHYFEEQKIIIYNYNIKKIS